MRKISATYVFTLTGKPLKNAIVVVDDSGTILEVIDTKGEIREMPNLEYYSGFLVPGFVNAHCHLQHSNLKEKVRSRTRLAGFLGQMRFLKNSTEEERISAARQADHYMFRSGTIAVADSTDSSLMIEIKEQSKIHYHTFFEGIELRKVAAPRAMEYAEFVQDLYRASKLECSVSPHSAYLVSKELLALILGKAKCNKDPISLHNQESEDEMQMFVNGAGALVDFLVSHLKLELPFDEVPGVSPFQYILPNLLVDNPLLLVHNTKMTLEDFELLKENRSNENTWLITCPKSNLFIEDQLPDYPMWDKSGFAICIGTDSLASNDSLSMLAEIETLQRNTDFSLNQLLIFACKNGANALRIGDWAGTIETGKKPGLNLITKVDMKARKLNAGSVLQKLV